MPGAWAELAGSAPQVQLDLVEMEPEEALPAVLRGAADVAIAHEYDLLPRPLDPLSSGVELVTDPVCVAGSRPAAPPRPGARWSCDSLTSQPSSPREQSAAPK